MKTVEALEMLAARLGAAEPGVGACLGSDAARHAGVVAGVAMSSPGAGSGSASFFSAARPELLAPVAQLDGSPLPKRIDAGSSPARGTTHDDGGVVGDTRQARIPPVDSGSSASVCTRGENVTDVLLVATGSRFESGPSSTQEHQQQKNLAPMTRAEAGRLGGVRTRNRYGTAHMRELALRSGRNRVKGDRSRPSLAEFVATPRGKKAARAAALGLGLPQDALLRAIGPVVSDGGERTRTAGSRSPRRSPASPEQEALPSCQR